MTCVNMLSSVDFCLALCPQHEGLGHMRYLVRGSRMNGASEQNRGTRVWGRCVGRDEATETQPSPLATCGYRREEVRCGVPRREGGYGGERNSR